MTAFVPF